MPKPEKVVLICNTVRPQGHPKGSCREKDSADVLLAFREDRNERELKGRVSVAESSCLGACVLGTIVAVMPDDIWYKGIKKEDVAEIMESHVLGGRPVERLLMSEEDWG